MFSVATASGEPISCAFLAGCSPGPIHRIYRRPVSRLLDYRCLYSAPRVLSQVKNPLIEYYIVESSGTTVPGVQTDLSAKGTLISDGGAYDIYLASR